MRGDEQRSKSLHSAISGHLDALLDERNLRLIRIRQG
ncbi:hypothetical protein L288_14115 [Sphingobium quisquiliarum P25]|uniref:Uncharacterized protein n=1 Tax=Sphingobium quisquiliarum P25 TaxID=1329909 RepID=T0I3J4_9SPHN|nr:hypothetical protein L288_14115 [Sphingobium quisquiliarum P25]